MSNNQKNEGLAEFQKLLGLYVKKFHESFPIYQAPSNNEELLKILRDSIKTGKPYKPEMEPNVFY